MEYFDKVIDILEKEFPEDWDEKILQTLTSEEDDNSEFIFILSTKISSTFEKVIYNLNLSILSGEYLILSDLDDKRQSILEKINGVVNGVVSGEFETSDFEIIFYDLIYGLREPIIIALNNYVGFYKEIKKRYSEPEKSSLFTSVLHEKFSVSQKIGIEKVKRLLNEFVDYNIPLAKIDHTLAVKSKLLESALIIKHSIEKSLEEKSNHGNVSILKILNDKCDYLVWKILTRYEKDPYNYFYALDYEDKQIEVGEFEPVVFGEFCELSKKIYIHSNQKENVNKFEEYTKGLKRKYKSGSTLDYRESFAIVKDMKDNPKTGVNELSNVLEGFNKNKGELSDSDHSFNEWAFDASYSYIHNNILSTKLKNKSLVVADIEAEYLSLNKIQYESDQKNYFPYLKLCKYLVNYLLPLYYDCGDVEKFSKAMELLEIVEKSLYESFEWCSDRNFIPYQLPFNESTFLYKLDGQEHNLFLASSFILPINFEKVDNEIKKISLEKDKYRNMINIFSSIQKQKAEIEKIKEGIEKTDKRHIEILSIFAAIVLFVSSSIQVFSNAKTFIDALRFMLVFGYVLVLFIFLVWLITRDNGVQDKKLPKFHVRLLSVLILSTIIALYLVVYPNGSENSLPASVVQEKYKKENKIPYLNRMINFIKGVPNQIYQSTDSTLITLPINDILDTESAKSVSVEADDGKEKS